MSVKWHVNNMFPLEIFAFSVLTYTKWAYISRGYTRNYDKRHQLI